MVDSTKPTVFQVTQAPKSASTLWSDLCEYPREELYKVDMDENTTYGLRELFETELPSEFVGFNFLDGKLSEEEDVKAAQKVFGEMSKCGPTSFENEMATWKDAREVFDVILNRGFVPVILVGLEGGRSASCFIRMVIENVGLSLVECVIGGGSFGVLVLKVKEKRPIVGSMVVLREVCKVFDETLECGFWQLFNNFRHVGNEGAVVNVIYILDDYGCFTSGMEMYRLRMQNELDEKGVNCHTIEIAATCALVIVVAGIKGNLDYAFVISEKMAQEDIKFNRCCDLVPHDGVMVLMIHWSRTLQAGDRCIRKRELGTVHKS